MRGRRRRRLLLPRRAVEADAVDTNVARFLLGVFGKLALDGSGATTLSVLNAVHTAGGAGLSVRAGLTGTLIAVDEFDVGVDVDRDMHVRDGGLLVRNAASARELRTTFLGGFTLHAFA